MIKLIRDARRAGGSLALAVALAAGGCADDDPGIPAADAARQADSDAAPPAEAGPAAWYFTADSSANAWRVAIVDPTDLSQAQVIEVSDLADLSGPSGNEQGPAWGDALASSDGRRVFANATSVDRVATFDTVDRSFEVLLGVGERPLHMYNPNQGHEIWSHADGEGAFYIINQATLAISDPVTKALSDTGHGKLLYAADLGARYYATNTNDPGAWYIDATGSGPPEAEFLQLCHVECNGGGGDDHDHAHGARPTPTHDGNDNGNGDGGFCGATHDRGYNPAMQYAIFECSGDSRGYFAFVDTTTNELVRREVADEHGDEHPQHDDGGDHGDRDDLFPIRGALAASPGGEYILVIDTGAAEDQVRVWDTGHPDHNGIDFEAALTVVDAPSPRGTVFWQNGEGDWEAWIPQTGGVHVAVVNLRTFDVDLVEIGALTAPDGAAFFSRSGAIGGDYFYSHNDVGAVLVELETRELVPGPALPGPTFRLTFAAPSQD
jgi:hypothetical protein